MANNLTNSHTLPKPDLCVCYAASKKNMIATCSFLLSNLFFGFKSILFDWIIKEQNSFHRNVSELSIDLKELIIDLNKSLEAISKQLQVPRSTVQTSVCKDEVHGTVLSLPRSGRKHKLSPAAERKLVRMVSQQKTNKKQVCNELEAAGRQVSVSTVRCVLHQHELRGCCARKKPLLQMQLLKA